jgi:glycosyltransferase involved in cell wall biosynthesis
MGSAEPESASCSCAYVDADPFSCTRFTGMARYTARLALALARRVPVRFFTNDQELDPPAGLDWSQDQDLFLWSRRVWRGRRRPLSPPPADSLALYCATRKPARRFPYEVSVLHDFSPLIVPETHTAQTRADFQGFFARTLLRSDLALAVSHSTKADAAWLSPMDPARVVVAHSGPSLCVEHHLHRRPVRRRPEVGLVVSTLEPRKNAEFLIDWFRTTTVLPSDAELWWVGPVGWLTSRRRLRQMAKEGSGQTLRWLGVVSDARLCRLYQESGWSIYPSLYEGFGFPVLDALRHGVPVLASGNSSLREFPGPGLHFFDPCDPATVDLAWRALEAERPVTIPRGPLDDHFRWDRVAAILLDAHARSRGVRDGRAPLAA